MSAYPCMYASDVMYYSNLKRAKSLHILEISVLSVGINLYISVIEGFEHFAAYYALKICEVGTYVRSSLYLIN